MSSAFRFFVVFYQYNAVRFGEMSISNSNQIRNFFEKILKEKHFVAKTKFNYSPLSFYNLPLRL